MRWRRGSRRQQVDVVVVGAGFAGLAAADRLVASGLDVLVLEEADRVGFRGSPSVLIDGTDPFSDPDAPVGLSCRVYSTPDGLAGSPTLEQLRTALSVR